MKALLNRPTLRFQSLTARYLRSPDSEIIKILDVYFVSFHNPSGDDLYITEYGLPYLRLLDPFNFLTDEDWYRHNSVRLSGTASAYRVRTKKVNGIHKDLVIKWNRMGQDIPGDQGSGEFSDSAFNSPFEEFSLVQELKDLKKEVTALRVERSQVKKLRPLTKEQDKPEKKDAPNLFGRARRFFVRK